MSVEMYGRCYLLYCVEIEVLNEQSQVYADILTDEVFINSYNYLYNQNQKIYVVLRNFFKLYSLCFRLYLHNTIKWVMYLRIITGIFITCLSKC